MRSLAGLYPAGPTAAHELTGLSCELAHQSKGVKPWGSGAVP